MVIWYITIAMVFLVAKNSNENLFGAHQVLPIFTIDSWVELLAEEC